MLETAPPRCPRIWDQQPDHADRSCQRRRHSHGYGLLGADDVEQAHGYGCRIEDETCDRTAERQRRLG
jgi:hypothetical protein